MKIYIAHSKSIDYINDLYKPIREDNHLKKYEIILPHEVNSSSSNTRKFYKSIDLYICECSEPATGLGIELGFAYDDDKPVYVLYKKGKKISKSVKFITDNIYEYNSTLEMIEIIKKIIGKI